MSEPVAWLCRVDGQEIVVWSTTIEEARLEARRHYQEQHKPVLARLATRTERGE